MNGRATAMILAIGTVLGACGRDAAGPNTKLTARADDPTGDTFGDSATQWDITAFVVTRDSGGVDVAIDFSVDPVSASGGSRTATYGFMDLDTDQDSTTGGGSVVDAYRRDEGSTGLGVEYYVNIGANVTVRAAGTTITATVTPTFSGKRLSFRVPRNLLGSDDGFLNAAVIVGTADEPTDLAPNAGHLGVGGTVAVATP